MRGKVLQSLAALFCACLLAACFQRFESIEVRATDAGIEFAHPKIEAAIKRGDSCVLHDLHVTRKSPEGDSREMWRIARPDDGRPRAANPLLKSNIIYGEQLNGMIVSIEPKPLGEGHYSVTGGAVIYDKNQTQTNAFEFMKEFDLKTDDAGKLIVTTGDSQ